MSLPVIPKKQFQVKSKFIPGGKLSLEPFNVGLESLLIQVKDAEDEQEKMSVVKQVVQECIKNDVQAGSLPIFSLEEVFLRLRENSIGELIDQQYQCTNVKEDETVCNKVMPVQIDTREFKIQEHEGHERVFMLEDSDIGIKFRYPSIDLFESAGADTTDEVETILTCIEAIFQGDTVWPAEDQTREDLKAFWNQLSLKDKGRVFENFFAKIPNLHYKKELTCTGCGHKHTIEFTNLQQVFQ